MRNKDLTNKERLEQIKDSIEKIELFCHKANASRFVNDSQLNSAVLLHFLIIGEAILHIEPSLLQHYKYPWHKVRSFRNLIAHEYHNITMEMVWKIVKIEVPGLKKVVHNMIKDEIEA